LKSTSHTQIFTPSLHDALPICHEQDVGILPEPLQRLSLQHAEPVLLVDDAETEASEADALLNDGVRADEERRVSGSERRIDLFADRKSTRLNSSHQIISYAVFC